MSFPEVNTLNRIQSAFSTVELEGPSYPLIMDLAFFHLSPFMLVNMNLISWPSFLSDS